ncbi:hypothetical protein PHET_01153 [Paragonimus heterotremus]|uniref:Uncharacterized protein n=1 Tax=Paragonimus heterotremus TaxID=100268 RepID=A0A8J4TMI1_9TREM|nr:hypothetical protein PHET_01153 [Paragonimus heterotremus]
MILFHLFCKTPVASAFQSVLLQVIRMLCIQPVGRSLSLLCSFRPDSICTIRKTLPQNHPIA